MLYGILANKYSLNQGSVAAPHPQILTRFVPKQKKMDCLYRNRLKHPANFERYNMTNSMGLTRSYCATAKFCQILLNLKTL